MLLVSLVAFALVALLAIIIGLRYLLASKFMPYHAQVAQTSWEDIHPRLQAVIIGMLRVMGGGFLGLGVTIIWLCYALTQGVRWAPWALMSISIVALVPMLVVAVQLRSVEPRAKTPMFPSLVAIALVAIGSIAALFH